LSFHQLLISSTCHFINLSFHQLIISSTCHFTNKPFHQQAISLKGHHQTIAHQCIDAINSLFLHV
jgi:hypothetical protein